MTDSIVQGKKHPVWSRYGVALFAIVLAAALRWALEYWGGESLPYFTFFAAVFLVALYVGFAPGLLAVGLSAVTLSLWSGPNGAPAIFSAAHAVIIVVFVIATLLLVWGCERMRRAIRREAEAEALRWAAETTIAGQEKTITEQAKALSAAERRLAFALDAGRIGVWDLDALTKSQQHDTIIGYEAPLSKWTYESFLDHVLEEDRPEAGDNFLRAIETGEDWNFECRILSADGQIRWVWVHGKRSEGRPRLLGLVEDITDRKRVEEALRDSEVRYRTIFETAVDAIITIDEHGIIATANPAAEELFGYTGEEMKGHNVKMLMPSPFHEHHDEYLENYRRTGIKKIIGIGRDVVALHKDGSTFPIHLAVSEMLIGKQRMFTGVVHDITESKRAEELLKEAIEIAEAANRAKDRFMAILSHELRTPLTPALMTVSALETDPTLTSDHREDMGTIRRNLELQARLIDDLLDLNRITRGKIELRLQVCDLHRMLGAVLEICRGDFEAKSLAVRLEQTATEHNVNGDASRLHQVFWNLLKNATKFTPGGGKITILTSNPHEGGIRVEVSDTGIGIAPQIIDRLFVPFEQGEAEITQRFGGMGLGLAISKVVMDLHGGKIWADSEGQGKGATFTVELPINRSEVSKEV